MANRQQKGGLRMHIRLDFQARPVESRFVFGKISKAR